MKPLSLHTVENFLFKIRQHQSNFTSLCKSSNVNGSSESNNIMIEILDIILSGQANLIIHIYDRIGTDLEIAGKPTESRILRKLTLFRPRGGGALGTPKGFCP